MKAARASGQFDPGWASDRPATARAHRGIRRWSGRPTRHMTTRQCRRHMSPVAGQHHAANGGDAEGTSDLEGHGVAGRSDPRVTPGTDPMTEFVAVGSMSPAPKPIRSRPGTTLPYVVSSRGEAETCHRPAAIDTRPAATVNLMPASRPATGDDGGADDNHDGDRQDPETGLERGVPQVELEQLGRQEQRPQKPEDARGIPRRGRQRIGDRGRTRARAWDGAARLPEDETTEHHETGQHRAITVPEVHPRFGPSMIAHSRSPRPAIDKAAPTGSGRCTCGFFESGTTSAAPTKPKHAIGTLTKKIEPHQNLDSRRPPAIGPMAIPSPMVPAHAPMARARSPGSRKTSLMMASEAGMVSAAPLP